MLLNFAFVLFVIGCGGGDGTADDSKVQVVATIGMITDMAERIGGDRVEVIGLMRAGVDPHLYKSSEGDVARMSEADIILYNGLHLEGAMTEVLERLGDRKTTVAVAETIPDSLLLSPAEYEGAHDPHVWFDVSLWMHAVETIRDGLIEVDPEGAQTYQVRTDSLLGELTELHDRVKVLAETVPEDKRILVTAHDAFNYFGRAYGFEVRGLQGISTAAEAGTADVQDLAEFIAEAKIPAIFVESSVSPRNIEAVQAAVKSRGWEVNIGGELYSDAMGTAGTAEGTYRGMVLHNINTIVSALLGQETEEG
jgi:manganese/zinc/iron transport system substrate-binding protein